MGRIGKGLRGTRTGGDGSGMMGKELKCLGHAHQAATSVLASIADLAEKQDKNTLSRGRAARTAESPGTPVVNSVTH